MTVYEFDTYEYTRTTVHHAVPVPAGLKVVTFSSTYYGSHNGNDIEYTFAVPEDSEVKLNLRHGSSNDNWSEEVSKLPEGSLVLDGDKFTILDEED